MTDSIPGEAAEQLPHVYIHNSHETEQDLCRLELQSLFGPAGKNEIMVVSDRRVDPDISPFIRLRLDPLLSAGSLEQLRELTARLSVPEGQTFKLMCIKEAVPLDYEAQRWAESVLGSSIQGTARMKDPDLVFGLVHTGGEWLLGVCVFSSRDYRKHRHKPHNYSTGLSVEMARSLVNIAVPNPNKITLIDPCCGMGNVLIEALSMGINIHGNEWNPAAYRGAVKNLEHFGYSRERVQCGDMNDLQESYDAAILDLPYNLCSLIEDTAQLNMLRSLRRMAKRAVVVSTADMDQSLQETGWQVTGGCSVRKGTFERLVRVCE
ncbi:RsmD family RNA methyltransferase [Paenibacillus sp. JX-17]|uniref:RsmD family RNA methyltransferase n=1 Tax=Paenibacillus lacisoli TaxID=3064525 RepID=A0ABT9CHV3_9BACL|nr:RsmD family RNA methyltransferase [Paenibacillus sp. JX-17]MDO7907183.1 RsmD family RNA methyltransferase [Paenibacillus sp. JX-17]